MRLAEGVDVPIVINDIETLAEIVDLGFYDPDQDIWYEFEISRRKNELYKFVNFYTSNKYTFLVGFNSIDFDQNVMQYIVEHASSWGELTGQEIVDKVHEFVRIYMDNSKYNIPPRYKEASFPIFPLDLYKINHFDNEAKRTSLKWCEFMMNMPVEEMPIHHDKRDLTFEDFDNVISYRRHDVKATLGLLFVTLGEPDRVMEVNGGIPVDHLSDYKGMNKLQDRFDVMEETGLKCLNWSDVKIGEEWNKLDYMKSTGIDDERLLMPTEVKYPYGKKFKKFFPKTMKFKTHHVNEFIKNLGEEYVKNETQEFPITIGNTTYTIAKGGIHSTEKNRAIITPKGYKYRDADVGSQYPNSIVKLEIYAPHLKRVVLDNFQGKIKLRITYKNKAGELKSQGLKIEARKFTSIQGLLKLCLNGGYYGKLGQKGSWLEFPEGLLRVCMGNQIEILMAIEAMELEGFQVLSGNTDGFTTLFPEDKEERYKEICKEWEEKVGNHILGKLEYVDYLKMYQKSINSYIGQYVDEKGNLYTKKKGAFVTTYGAPGCEINKNKSKRIIPLALEAYFINGKDPIEFIKNHNNIYDFLIAKKATGQMHYEEVIEGYQKPIQLEIDPTDYMHGIREQDLYVINDRTKEVVKKYKKLIVYYICNDGNVLFKRGLNNKGNAMNNHCEAEDDNAPEIGQPLVRYFNDPFSVPKFSDYNINYNYYIYQTLKIMDEIEKTNKTKSFLISLRTVKQISLF